LRRRAWTVGPASLRGTPEFYLYDDVHRVAVVNRTAVFPQGLIAMSFLYDGIDHPLRLGGTGVLGATTPESPFVSYSAGPHAVAYYELDLAGNVRRLRAPGGADLGGYRYGAFGATREDTVQPSIFGIINDLDKQPLRWKGMWRFDLGAGTELYDARARMWSPALGSFLSVDEFDFHDPTSTLWAWPNQNPITFSDPFGRDGTTSNPVQDLVDSGFLPPGLTIFGKGTRMRATGISMMANDATFEAGMAKMNCGNAMIAAGAGVLATDAQVIGGIADAAIGAANAVRGGGSYRAVRSANTGGEVHHTPAWAGIRNSNLNKNPFTHGNSPGILMETADHAMTPSYGRGFGPDSYRALQTEMINAGQFLDAMKMDVDFIRAAFGTKYDSQIQQMGEAFWLFMVSQ
jgi:RHS repeat-associated protein